MATANDDYDDATIALDLKQKGNIYIADNMANVREDYDDASIAIDSKQVGYLYCNEHENYYSSMDYTQGKITTACTTHKLRGVSKNVSNELIDNMASKSRHHVRLKRNLKCHHNATIVKTQRSILKLVITLSFAIVAITVASSSYAVVKIKQDLKEEISTLKRSSSGVNVWSSWSMWDDCCGTRTVDLRTRNRTCDGSRAMCQGNDVDVSTCDHAFCNVSYWSTWSMWGQCSVTCGHGLRTRNRTCDGMDQYETYMPCIGNDIDISTCHEAINFYSIPSVFFSAHTVIGYTPVEDQVLVFKTNLYNQGEGYNNSTGLFTAPVTGVYQFTVQLCTSQNGQITVDIIMNGNTILNNTIGDTSSDICSSVDTLAEMKQGLRARVVANHVIGTNIIISRRGYFNKFSGILINI